MIAYKFLAAGARGPLTQIAWPTEGWLVADGAIAVGKNGIHACRAEDLSHWLHDELWEVELAGATLDGPDCVVAERARLIRKLPWDALAFARACVARARELGGDAGMLDDADQAIAYGYPAVAAHTAAVAIARDDEAAYGEARAWQSAWIVRNK